ncbi:prohead protease/major capsid protein fusion protein [Mesobacterium pallidum]|uniref:prohead protease/major capsid protein fusion protein n=1 Tax=Mesobacterium pallidum TaxID=2872037 RepID=UPI001EE1E319|nr:prohead protease/major capsid protein fusion protein [Mesobacterium pallidum]
MPLDDLLFRRGDLTPASFDSDAMTVEAVISTFADVTRRDARGSFTERLDPAGLDLSGLVGAPVLDGHRQGSARDVVGTVTAYRMEPGALVATIRLSSAADAAPVVDRIREGTLRGVSIGYRVTRWEPSNSRARLRTAAAWRIFEVSAVPIPADLGATFRSQDMEPDEIEITTETREDDRAQTRAAIRQIARSAGMTSEQADDMVDRELSITEARAEAFEAMQDRGRTTPRIRTATREADNPATVLQHRSDALYARVSGEAPSDAARPYMSERLLDVARACVEATGTSTRAMDADQLFRAAMHTSSDFPQLLTSTGNRTLVAAYQAAQSPVKTTLARQSTLADFRPGTRLKLSDIGTLGEVSESGEIKHTSRAEASESYALDTYATQFAISRKALINDDLGAFRDWGATAGRMAAETEANLLLSLLLSNPTMGEDATALFHADHGNLASPGTSLGSVADITALDVARKAMRGMKALDGVTPINATPKYLLVGPELETQAEQVLAQIYATTFTDANPFTGRLTLLVEPRITDESWYLFADPAALPVLEYSYLSSAQGPQMASREGWDVLGMEFRVVLDFGCGAVDWRGAYLNPGD